LLGHARHIADFLCPAKSKIRAFRWNIVCPRLRTGLGLPVL
jgi:hypothetical protein